MRKLVFFSCLLCCSCLQAQLLSLKRGMTITSSATVKSSVFNFSGQVDTGTAVINIQGNNIVVDFNHAVLEGNEDKLLPDQLKGIAIRIVSGSNITIKNLSARGYKIALIAKGIKGLTIENCDFSYNYRQHLNSTQQKEDLSDWMSYHHNEQDEWLRYGAAIYLRGCKKAVIHDNSVTNGQCALMLTQCDSGHIYNNNFSFNSGLGIGMYRSSGNTVMYNKLDFNVRGHSEGVYNRGQDAAAILVFEQCNNNVFALNSATHSGDGFFLWAGQTTMDNGQGGCNDNLIFKNDFSYAPTNGVEVTFSRNRIVGNKMIECDNGIWGGYSYNTAIKSNQIANCNTGIAIEHGQDNDITFNRFYNCGEALKLWGRASQPTDWGYANKRDTRSRNYQVGYNSFSENKTVFNFARTEHITGIKNDTARNLVFLKTDSTVHDMKITGFSCCDDSFEPYTAQEKKIINRKIQPRKDLLLDAVLSGRRQIRMTEWGPYDFKSPLLWNTNAVATSDTMHFELIGPKGNWRLVGSRGLEKFSFSSGSFPATISAIKTNEKGQDVFVEMEYTGENIITPFGQHIASGKIYRFSYRNDLLPADWHISWYGFDSTNNPIKNADFIGLLENQEPIATEHNSAINYAWWYGVGKEKKAEQFLTVAETDIDFPEGEYRLGLSWEDVLRVYIDGQLLVDEWKPSAHVYDESPHRDIAAKLAGKHRIRVEQANQNGFATLIIKLKKK